MIPSVDRLFEKIEIMGWKGRIVPAGHLDDLREAISDRHRRGLLDDRLYREQLDSFTFYPPVDLPDTRSIVIVAVPTPQMRTIFRWQGREVPLVIPPTYVSYRPRTAQVQATLRQLLRQDGFRLAAPFLPLKTLAVRSGLAEYGRNNITYVNGMGSFLQLVAGFTDLPCDEDPWREPKALDRCTHCVACVRRCPTGAISEDRFLIRAERCLTYHNEAAAEFPDWIGPSWHHCLIGCMQCQAVCPENKSVVDWFEDRAGFSEEETALFVERVAFDRLPAETAAKLKNLEINEDYRFLCRNLAMVLLHQS